VESRRAHQSKGLGAIVLPIIAWIGIYFDKSGCVPGRLLCRVRPTPGDDITCGRSWILDMQCEVDVRSFKGQLTDLYQGVGKRYELVGLENLGLGT
jgi:hypothetical protein